MSGTSAELRSTMHSFISSLIDHGRILASQLQEAKLKHKQNANVKGSVSFMPEYIHQEVETTILKLLDELDKRQGILSFDVDSISVAKVLKKIEQTLQRFSQVDHFRESKYVDLVKKVIDCRRQMQSSGGTSLESRPTDDYSRQHSANFYSLQEQFEFEAAYGSLPDKEKQCLFCFSMFLPAMEIKKRELIHMWIGLDLVDPLYGNEVVGKLEAEGLIDRVTRNKKVTNKYKMHDSVLIRVKEKMGMLRSYHALKENNFGIMHNEHRDDNVVVPEKVKALLNINRYSLNAKTFEWLSKMKNIEMIVLGSSCPALADRSLEIERVNGLNAALKGLRKVKYLSLQGISRLVKLPTSVYKLQRLKVLDLKACHDLMYITKAIVSLSQLTHLDLSECYMLDHIPKGLANLTQLIVLKGYMINDDTDTEPNVSSNLCRFDDLSRLNLLRKLAIRTRRMNFPTNQDLQTLCNMEQLNNLRIAWVGRPGSERKNKDDLNKKNFPKMLKKLELQAAPAKIASQLLSLISRQTLEKLYIKGGQLWDLCPEKDLKFIHVKVLSLRYLPKLHVSWYEFEAIFPNLSRLEIYQCPNLIFFPCDGNGIWEQMDLKDMASDM